jgi:hypothetical protein
MRPSPAVSLVAVVRANDLEEAREVILDHAIEPLGRELLRQPRVALHIEEEHGNIRFALLELPGIRASLQQELDGLRHELGQLALDLLEHLDLLHRLREVLQGGGGLGIARFQVGARGLEAIGQIVDHRSEVPDLVAAGRHHPHVEVSGAHAPRRGCHLGDRFQDAPQARRARQRLGLLQQIAIDVDDRTPLPPR